MSKKSNKKRNTLLETSSKSQSLQQEQIKPETIKTVPESEPIPEMKITFNDNPVFDAFKEDLEARTKYREYVENLQDTLQKSKDIIAKKSEEIKQLQKVIQQKEKELNLKEDEIQSYKIELESNQALINEINEYTTQQINLDKEKEIIAEKIISAKNKLGIFDNGEKA